MERGYFTIVRKKLQPEKEDKMVNIYTFEDPHLFVILAAFNCGNILTKQRCELYAFRI